MDTAHQERITVRSGQQLWDWCLGDNPIHGMLVADMNAAQRSDMVRVLDGMVREHADRTGTAVFTAPVNTSLGTSSQRTLISASRGDSVSPTEPTA